MSYGKIACGTVAGGAFMGTIASQYYNPLANQQSNMATDYYQRQEDKRRHEHEFMFSEIVVIKSGFDEDAHVICKTCGREDSVSVVGLSEDVVRAFFKEKSPKTLENIAGLIKIFAIYHPELINKSTVLKVKHNHMPRIFRLAIYLALTIMVWRAVLNIDHIILFIINLFHIHG